MKILAINAGSSSLKFQIVEMPSEKVITKGLVERIGDDNAIFNIKVNDEKKVFNFPIKNHEVAVDKLLHYLLDLKILKSLDEIKGIGHRIVQGGEKFNKSVLITDEVIKTVESLNHLAPLHNPANITGIRAFQKALPNVKQVGVFDTTFHSTMTPEAFLYASDYSWYEKYGVRKYGFHGTSYRYVSDFVIKHLELENKESKIIVCHLGNGASIAAIKNGKSIDTSMGLTPLEGIPMGTRSGNIDPSVIELISEKENISYKEVLSMLNKKSGFLGVSGLSNDSRDIVQGVKDNNKRAILAFDIQIKRIVDYIASYYVYLGGCDCLCFTAGIGENAPEVRKAIVDRLSVLGIYLCDDKNSVRGTLDITCPRSKNTKVLVVPTDEEIMIVRDTVSIIG